MDGRLSRGNPTWQRWAAVLILLMIVPVAISFNARLATIRQMRQDEARLKQAVATEQTRQANLKLLRSYVASDAYVEHWARVNARMTQPGQVAVIPIGSSNALLGFVAPVPDNVPASILDEWWALFFDETPTFAFPRE